MIRFCRISIGLMICLFLVGCGDGLVRPKGRVIKGGAPFQPGESENLRIILAPLDAPQGSTYDSYPAEYNREDATFRVVGKEGKGLPPGKYLVGVELIKHKDHLFRGTYTV